MPPIETLMGQDNLEVLNANPLIREALNLIPISQKPNCIGTIVFPEKQIPATHVRYRTINLDMIASLVTDTLRGLDAQAKTIKTERDLASATVDEHMIKIQADKVKIQEAAENGINYVAEELSVVREVLVLAKEFRHAALGSTPGNFATRNKKNDVDFAERGVLKAFNDATDVITGEAIRMPNTLALSLSYFRKLQNNPEIIERYRGAVAGGVRITTDILKDYFFGPQQDVQVVVGFAGYKDNGVFQHFWDDCALLTYSERTAPSLNNMSFGYTATRAYANGISFDTRQADISGIEGMMEAGCCERYKPLLTNENMGFLWYGHFA